ncbi:MAG: TOMM precursor leader peptide-binding protein [Vicinamibacterales bacterium]
MPTTLHKPLLPAHYSLWSEPPDEAGDEALHIVSERRSIKLKGKAFREFRNAVVPLLDGRHTLDDIHAATATLFDLDDLAACIALLADHGVVVEGEGLEQYDAIATRLAPQLNFFHDVLPNVDVQARLGKATVAVLGLSGAGAGVALTLGAAGVGHVRCVDASVVVPADVYLSPLFTLAHVGSPRTACVTLALAASAPETRATADNGTLQSEDDLRRAIGDADYIVCCLDAGQSNLVFKLNRVCLALKKRWVTCALSGDEIVLGPGIDPWRTACYLCYRMRTVACSGNPEDAYAYERHLDRRKHDDSDRRENLVFGAGLAANFLGLEVVKAVAGMSEPSLAGRLLTIRLTNLTIQRHSVLRKPWCPACFAQEGHTDGH